MAEETEFQTPTGSPTGLPASAGSAFVVKQFVECPNCGKLWLYDGHAADVCCGGCSHNFYVPPDAITRRLIECESVLRSVVKNVPIMVAGFRGTLLHSKCVGLVGEQNDKAEAPSLSEVESNLHLHNPTVGFTDTGSTENSTHPNP